MIEPRHRAQHFCSLYGITLPILNAPMPGIVTAELVAAVSEAGGIGVIPADFSTARELGEAIDKVARLTRKPVAVNLRVPVSAKNDPRARVVTESVAPLKEELGCAETFQLPDFDALFDVVCEKRVPFVTVSFGGLREIYFDRLKDLGIKTIGTATTLLEAKVQAASRADMVIVQGMEAGGPRLNFESQDKDALVGLFNLIGPAVRATALPVVAAGGIMTGRQMAAALIAGASAVQLGTYFLKAAESATHPLLKAKLDFTFDAQTKFTRFFSGRLTRVIPNELMDALQNAGVEAASYPEQLMIMKPIDEAAKKAGRDDLMVAMAGQGADLCRAGRAKELIERLMADFDKAVAEY